MNRKYDKQKILIPYILMSILACVMTVSIFFVKKELALIFSVVLIVSIIIGCIYLIRSIRNYDQYIGHLSTSIDHGKKRAIRDLPIGVILLDENDVVEWHNQFMFKHINRPMINEPINELFPNLLNQLKVSNLKEATTSFEDRHYKVFYSSDTNILYFFDISDAVMLENMYEDAKPVVGTLFLDNYDEITQNMSDAQRSEINSMMTSEINRWAEENQVFVKRYSADQYMLFLNQKILHDIEQTKFNLLDDIREKNREKKTHITLSVGIGEGADNLVDLGALAQSSLDLALGRGGDQVAIKNENGNVRFYGGKTDPMEKRTRVRARVISHALRDILIEGDNVIVMGHKRPDMDAIGAAIGVARFAKMNNLTAHIVLNDHDIDDTLSRVMEEIKEKEELHKTFVTSEEAWNLMTRNTTLVIVDTNKPDMVIDESILNKAQRKVVIDHHRRGEEFISSPLLVYMEQYASSTAELVTELLEYQPTEHKLTRLEATVMLAGIIVDTRNFTLRTGSRTFDAASFLRSHGADTILCQHFLKDDIETYIKRSEIIKTVELEKNGIAIAHGSNDEIIHPVTVAQAADELLSLEGVEASFVFAKRADNIVGVSARSLGEINVQVVMEKLGGGGHLTNAAAQLKDISIEEAILQLHQVITESDKGED
ncbi:DHH family phosphoesterase [Macrococcus sp. DPC7161]|uniref:DHH family phosphoesterase n=1 Tax=Macrococcus sp. DPC7161 TaxID=2507060 RepID=UPI00100BBF62|nr:DHH family phosphoesterase [Macrococcus sp. DPC7161]RXK18534.1 DHH family phosphoesterase [Macrococcus sp. DPC7161]